MIRDALAALRARRGRTLLAALGVLAASLVVGTATTVGYSLATGFDRAAEQSDLPDVLARFTRAPRDEVDARVSALPNLAGALLPQRAAQPAARPSGTHRTGKGAVTAVLGGRRGYLIVDGRDLRDGEVGEAVIERGLAREWDIWRRRHARPRGAAIGLGSTGCGSSGSRSRPTTSRSRSPRPRAST